MVDQKADPLVGTTIEKVRLISRLGSGGMGTVYLGEHATLEKRVALKILADHLAKDPEFVSRFLTEARTTSKLEHPNIVRVYDIGYAGDKYFIMMQYVDGEPLQRLVEAMGPLDPRDAARVMIKVLRALHYAHGVGIVHRDVKPANILVGAGNEPFLVDFGLAIETNSAMKLTAAGTVVGTPWYISPEQANGHRAEPRSDVYSAGITLYTLLAGRPPFQANTALAVLNKHIHETPIPPGALNPRVPPVLDAIVMKMLAKKTHERYVTAETAARDLEAFLENRAISMARSPSSLMVPKVAPPPPDRGPVAWILGAAALVMLGALTVVALRRPTGELTQPKNGNTAQNPPPPPFTDPAHRLEIDRVRREMDKIAAYFDPRREDFGQYPLTMREYNDARARFVTNKEAVQIIDEAIKLFVEYADTRARPEADRISVKVQALIREDPYAALAAYREFPKPLLDVCPAGKGIAEARAKLEADLNKELPNRLKAIEAMIRDEDFAGARVLASKLLDHVPDPHHPKLRELLALADDREAKLRETLAPRLAAEIEALQKGLIEPLSNGRTDAAWSMLCDYVARKPAAKLEGRLVRAPRVDYETLATLNLQEMIDGDVESRLRMLGELQSGEDEPSLRVLLLFEDVARREWLQRRAARGLLRMAGTTVQLHGFGRGRLAAGEAPTWTPEGGEARPFPVRSLAPGNLIHLAAAADYGLDAPVVEAYTTDKRICLAGGVAYLYSNVRDRYHAAHRWIQKAHELGGGVPGFRIRAIHQELAIEADRLVAQLCQPALRMADQGKWDDARRALDAVDQQYKDDDLRQTLVGVLDVQRARFFLQEAAAAKKKGSWARVREIVVKHLRSKRFEGLYDKDAADALYVEAVLRLGYWQNAPIPSGDLLKQKFWTWGGRDPGTPPPAKVHDGGLRLSSARPLLCAPEMVEGYTGMSAKVRLNLHQMPFRVGLLLDNQGIDPSTLKYVVATSGVKLVLEGAKNQQWVEQESEDLPAKIVAGDWHEIAFVVEDGRIYGYFDGKCLFSAESGAVKGTIGLMCEGDWTFKDIRIRDMKPR